MSNSVVLIGKIKKENDLDKFNVLLSEYINQGYSVDTLLEVTSKFRGNKRNLVLDHLVDDMPISSLDKIGESKYLNDADRVYVIKKLMDDNIHISTLPYLVMEHIDAPKKYFSKEEIKRILTDINSEEIIDNYGAYFAEELLDLDDLNASLLLKIKKDLPNNVINMIYEKSFNSWQTCSYIEIILFLNDEEKKEYAKLFLESNINNYVIAKVILFSGFYYKKDKPRLLKILAYATADIIYDVLMNETLNKKQTDVLEKALFKTGNIEYISYYYFFKDREKFASLFGSALLFLSFVTLNKEKFNNSNILDTIISEIKEEEILFKDSVNSKINAVYHKKMK